MAAKSSIAVCRLSAACTSSVPERLAEQLDVEADYVDLTPRAAGLVACADLSAEPAPLQPAYLRRPDAVPPKPTPKSPAIPEVEV